MSKAYAATMEHGGALCAQERIDYARRACAACALLCGNSAVIGAFTLLGGNAPECLLPTIGLAVVAAFALAVAASPSFARKVVELASRAFEQE